MKKYRKVTLADYNHLVGLFNELKDAQYASNFSKDAHIRTLHYDINKINNRLDVLSKSISKTKKRGKR